MCEDTPLGGVREEVVMGCQMLLLVKGGAENTGWVWRPDHGDLDKRGLGGGA